MWGALAYVAAVVGAGLLLRGVFEPGLGFLAAAAAFTALGLRALAAGRRR
jgi:hypothetical protein